MAENIIFYELLISYGVCPIYLIKLAKALHVSIDELVFEEDERAPNGKLKLMFEAVEQLKQKDQDTIQELLQGMISRYESNRFSDAEIQ